MVAYNFAPRHARAIIFGTKSSAVRPHKHNADHVALGGLVHAFTGFRPPDYQRSPDCHRLLTAPCVRSDPIVFDVRGAVVAGERVVNGHWLECVAQADGFATFGNMQAHVDRRYGLPWEGQFIRWDPNKAEFRAQWPLVVKPPEGDTDDTE